MESIYNYIYGVYLSFAYSGGGGGGGTDPTNVGVQTGDFVLATIFSIFTIALILAVGVFFARKLKPEIFENATSKFGVMAKSASARKVFVAFIFGFSMFCLIAYSITARALADPSAEAAYPAPPPYSHATALIDKESGNVSIDNVHITDAYCKENNFHATIMGIRINTINGFDPSELGT